jgi:pSer/pThr/pTyr-binding forkhead associated (FHA) protein
MLIKYRVKNIRSGEIYSLVKQMCILGRSMQCDIAVDSGLLSRQHAALYIGDHEKVTIKDLDSTNGTYVNGVRVSFPVQLDHGDIIGMGDENFVLIDADKDEAKDLEHESLFNRVMHMQESTGHRTMIGAVNFASGKTANGTTPKPDTEAQWVARILGQKKLDANRIPAVLLVKTGIKKDMLIELKLPMGAEKEWSIGRNQLCDVVLEDPTVSNIHAFIQWENGCWEIQDNQSTNGILLNGKKINRSLFQTGDQLSIGNIGLIFRTL